jgi:hypothetical protein
MFWLTLSAFAADHAAGAFVSDAASVQLTPDGLHAVADLVPAVFPTAPTPVAPVSDSGGFSCFNYAYGVSNVWVGTKARGADLVAGDGALQLVLDLDVWVNDSTDKFRIDYELFCGDSSCPGYVLPFPVTATVPFTLAVVPGPDGHGRLDATMGEVGLVHGLTSDDIELDCAIDTIDEVLDYFGLSIYEILIGIAEDQLKAQIDDQKADLEAQLEEVLAAAVLDTTVDVAGIPLHVGMWPETVEVTRAGLQIGTEGLAEAPSVNCVVDPGVSVGSDGRPPGPADAPKGGHAGALVSDDFANQALYALWRGGLLCTAIDPASSPIALDTNLLTAIGGEPWKQLFPVAKPLEIKTDPRRQPVAKWDGTHDVGLVIEDLGVEIFAEVDHRKAHVLGIALAVDAGLDLAFDGTTGKLDATVDLPTDAIVPTIHTNELVPGTEPALEKGLTGLIGTLAGDLLAGAIPELSFSVPAMDGLGLKTLEVGPGGDGTWLGLWATIGPVPYTGAEGGCGGGCNSGGLAGAIAVATAFASVRRRRG